MFFLLLLFPSFLVRRFLV